MHLPDRPRLQARCGARDRRHRRAGRGSGDAPQRRATVAERPPAWEEPLRALITQPALQERGNPLAIEVALRATGVAGGGALRLMARLMRPGARGDWVNGSLAWNDLDWQAQRAELRGDHVALARELFAAQRVRQFRESYYRSYGADKAIDLSGCGAQMWSILDDAARIGVHLIHAGKGLGEIARPLTGEIVIDVTRQDDGGACAAAELRVDGEQAEALRPVLFLGADGHGLVCADASDGADIACWRLRLVRLTRPAGPGAAANAPRRRAGHDRRRRSAALRRRDLPRAAQRGAGRLVGRLVHATGGLCPVAGAARSIRRRARSRAGLGMDVPCRAARPGTRPWGSTTGSTASATARPSGQSSRRGRSRGPAWSASASSTPTGVRPTCLCWCSPGSTPCSWRPTACRGCATWPGVDVEVEGEPAEYRDVADTLQIGVSTADIAGERDWFDLGVTIRVDGRELPFADVFVALASGQSHMLLDDGAHFSLAEPRLQSLRALIEEARGLADPASPELRISRYQADLWAELAALGVVTEQADAWQRQVGALLELDALSEHAPPATLQAEMRPYQRDGFAWLASLWDLELGGILADDMGLGKTLQTLALIAHVDRRDADAGPVLVVAPTSVVPNWVAEAARFTPSLSVRAVTDTLAKSGRRIGELASADVVVTTYTLLRLDVAAYRSVDWAGVILDEAQAVKNHRSKTYKCVRELASPFKLALTGTPMENNLMELWSLLSITAPGLFPDPARFAEDYARPIERGRDGERLARLRRRIKPLVKRRTKELVAADLPAKQEQSLELELHPRHRSVYDTYLQRERQKVLRLLGDFDRNRFTILRSITLLRRLSLDPGLVDERSDGIPSAKIAALAEQLEDVVGGGHRALVFSQFTSFLAKVRDRLDDDGIEYCYLDGRTRRRDQVLDSFKTGTARSS